MHKTSKNIMKSVAAVFVFIAVAIAIVLIIPAACTDENTARRVLSENGYKNINITGYRFFNGTNDQFVTGFEATSPSGSRVSGVVSNGWLKGATIRFD